MPPQGSRWWASTARVAFTAAVVAFLVRRADVSRVGDALVRIRPATWAWALAVLAASVGLGVVRWRILLAACGARKLPAWTAMARWYFVAMFYNFLPGAIGGDVLRGYAMRPCFAQGAAVRAVGTVLIERALGLAGLFIVAACASFSSSLAPPEVLPLSAAGLAAVLVALSLLTQRERLAGLLPDKLAPYVKSVPVVRGGVPLLAAIALSVAVHLLMATSGHLLVSDLSELVAFKDSLVVFPLATLAAFFPLTIAGAGARDTALLLLLGHLGVPEADAIASSLAVLVCHLTLGAIGGLLRAPKTLGLADISEDEHAASLASDATR